MGLTSIALARQMYCNMQSSGGEIAVNRRPTWDSASLVLLNGNSNRGGANRLASSGSAFPRSACPQSKLVGRAVAAPKSFLHDSLTRRGGSVSLLVEPPIVCALVPINQFTRHMRTNITCSTQQADQLRRGPYQSSSRPFARRHRPRRKLWRSFGRRCGLVAGVFGFADRT